MSTHLKARNADNIHLMPVYRTVAVGRTLVRMARVSTLLPDNADERAWCERVRAGFVAAGVLAVTVVEAGIAAVYREVKKRKGPLFSRHAEPQHRQPPKTVRIRALVRTWEDTTQRITKRRVERVVTIHVPAREYRCEFCGRAFWVDEHGAEYLARGGKRGARMVWTHEHTGRNKHSRCCVECLPKLCAMLPMCDVDAEMDRKLELWGVKEG